MTDKEKEEKESFKVIDKRLRPDDDQTKTQSHDEEKKDDHVRPINFSSFILSLATSVLVFLGEENDPSSGKKNINLSQASEMIDILDLLEKKTKGNLTPEEDNLMKSLLFTLRMKFVEESKKTK